MNSHLSSEPSWARNCKLWCSVAISFSLLLASSRDGTASSQEPNLEVGPVIGGGAFQINTPKDPPGSQTFLYGSAFSGAGMALGANGVLRLKQHLGLHLDLLYSWSSLTGFAESHDFRREITFGIHSLRLAVLARFGYGFANVFGGRNDLELSLSLGPELSAGIAASWREIQEGFEDPGAGPLRIDTNLVLIPVVQLGLDFGPQSYGVHLSGRFGYNPFYPDLTSERFEGFVDADQPGVFILDVDWYLLSMVGVRFSL